MSIFLLGALLLPSLFWTKGPDTGPALHAAGIASIAVPPSLADAWKSNADFKTGVVDPSGLIKAAAPAVNYRAGRASATQAPWVDSNGGRFLRQPDGTFFYDAPGATAALAAAEAYAFGIKAVVQTDDAGLKPFADMLQFLQTLAPISLPALVNFQYVDDGSPASGEFMNLLVRTNLLFKAVKTPDAGPILQVQLGTPQYPESEAGNPKLLAEKVRAEVTDEKRLLRIYGSSVVIGRLIGSATHVRLFLLNYGSARGDVDGIRVRVLGDFSQHQGTTLEDYRTGSGFTEFTLTTLPVCAVIDLQR